MNEYGPVEIIGDVRIDGETGLATMPIDGYIGLAKERTELKAALLDMVEALEGLIMYVDCESPEPGDALTKHAALIGRLK